MQIPGTVEPAEEITDLALLVRGEVRELAGVELDPEVVSAHILKELKASV